MSRGTPYRRLIAGLLSAIGLLMLAVTLPLGHQPEASAQTLEEAYRLVDTWDGTEGQGPPGSLFQPAGITLGGDKVFIVDRGNDRVQRFSTGGEFEAAWGGPGGEAGQLDDPRDLAVEENRVYVTDTGNDRLQVFGLDGQPEDIWTAAQFSAPWGVAAAGPRVYVTLPDRGEVVVFQNGAIVERWSVGTSPRGLDVGPDGRIYVADSTDHRVRILSPQGVETRAIDTNLPAWDVAVDETHDLWVMRRDAVLWYRAGSGNSDTALYYDGLQGVTASSERGIYGTVASDERQRHWVVQWAWRSRDRLPVAEWRILGYPPGRLQAPSAIHAGADGLIWIADAWPRIQGFEPDGRPGLQRVIPEPAVDMIVAADSSAIVGENRRLVRVHADGTISGTARLAEGTTQFWLTAMAPGPEPDTVRVMDSATLAIREYSTVGPMVPLTPTALAPAPWRLYWDMDASAGSDRARLVNRSEGTVEVMDGDQHIATRSVDGTVIRAAAGPDGSLFVLTLDGLVWKLSPGGQVVAAWDAAAFSAGASQVVDLAVDANGRVYTLDKLARTVRVWDVDPDAEPEPPRRRGGACRLSGDKRALPETVRLGQDVTVELEVGGSCPQRAPRADIFLVIDRSYTMVRNNGITATLGAARAFINDIDLTRDRVGIVAFNSAPSVLQGLTSDRTEALAALDRIQPIGGTDIALAFSQTADELLATVRPDTEPVIVLLTDGRDREPDDAMAAAAGAKAAGVRIFTVGFGDIDPMVMVLSATAPEDAYYAPDTAGLEAIYQEIARRITASVLATSLTVVDTLPTNMAFRGMVSGPDPTVQGQTLRWTVTDIPFNGWQVAYRVRPSALGRHPTNVSATADFVDGLNNPGELIFPVPEVHVIDREPTPTPTSTPFPTTTPTPRPDRLFLPIVLNQKCQDAAVHADVALVLDTSGSMAQETPGGGTKLAASIRAARVFVTQLNPEDQAAVVSFHTDATVEQALTSDRDQLLTALDNLATGSGTRIDRGIDRGREALEAAPLDPSRNRVMILMTDGRSDDVSDEDVVAAADFAKGQNVRIFTIGLGADVDPVLLQRVASRPDYYFGAPSAEELESIYREIAYTLPCVNLTWP